jgi:hypothetical protein
MLKDLFTHRLFIGVFVLLMCAVVSVYFLRTDIPDEPVKIYTPVEPLPKSTAETPVAETPPQGHVHDDGAFHPEPHETSVEPPVQYTAPQGAVTAPDFPAVDPSEDPVEAAYKRLEYIKNNPYAWGGVHSERATELIAQLMPLPEIIDHDHGDEVSELMYELTQQGDPRAAEVFAAPMSATEGYMGGNLTVNALVEIGPPAVPYILPHLEKGVIKGGVMSIDIFRSLSRIAAAHRGDLGGIVDHIIIPKLEVIAADENNERYSPGAVIDAQEALSVLQQ